MTLTDRFQPRLIWWTRGLVIDSDDDDELIVAPMTVWTEKSFHVCWGRERVRGLDI